MAMAIIWLTAEYFVARRRRRRMTSAKVWPNLITDKFYFANGKILLAHSQKVNETPWGPRESRKNKIFMGSGYGKTTHFLKFRLGLLISLPDDPTMKMLQIVFQYCSMAMCRTAIIIVCPVAKCIPMSAMPITQVYWWTGGTYCMKFFGKKPQAWLIKSMKYLLFNKLYHSPSTPSPVNGILMNTYDYAF